jgi:hypothetical protein
LALNLYLRAAIISKNLDPGLLRSVQFWGAALVLGGLAFLNTWDFRFTSLYSAASVLVVVRDGCTFNACGIFIGTALSPGSQDHPHLPFISGSPRRQVGSAFGLFYAQYLFLGHVRAVADPDFDLAGLFHG